MTSAWTQTIEGEAPVGPRLQRADDADGFVEAVGERMALLGSEGGRMEVWMWPLLLVHDLEVRVTRRDGAALALGARAVEVVPEGLGLSYTLTGLAGAGGGPARLALDAFCPRHERALVLLLRLDIAEPVDVVLEFTPAFRPMWPAGLGGQITGRDDATGAFFMTEEIGRFAALFGSPEASPVQTTDAEPGRRGVRGRNALTIPVSPKRAARGPIPVVCAGAALTPRPLTEAERRGGNQAATGASRATLALDEARALWRRMLIGWPDVIAAERRRWRAYLARTATLLTGDAALDEAFLWSKLAIERAWVEVDGVGRGLVAGLGPGRGTERPGFAWLFNGDALEACRALAIIGDHEGCRAILRFAASTQRDDGKLTHEVTLSAALCDWYGEFPYAYYKGNQTPEFIAALGRYVRWSRDTDLALELWPAVERAVDWCLSVCDEELVMQVPLAGIAAVEAGPLSGAIQAEAFLQAAFEDAVRELVQLEQCTPLRWPARWGALRAFVADDRFGRAFTGADGAALDFARLTDGTRHPGPSAYTQAYLSRGTPPRALLQREVLRHNHPRLMADWGARMFATDVEGYAPEHYNMGSVFPFLTQYHCIAALRSGLPGVGWQVLTSQVQLMHFGGLGYMPEFLPGDRARLLPHVVPHQIFSHAALLQCILDGLLGLSRDAATGAIRAQLAERVPLQRAALVGALGDPTLRLEAVAEAAAPGAMTPPTILTPSGVTRDGGSRQPRLVAVSADGSALTFAGTAGSTGEVLVSGVAHTLAFPPAAAAEFSEVTLDVTPRLADTPSVE
ncbi:MAG: hypothetical protein R3F49_07545 [Planctomycetota bacterium]